MSHQDFARHKRLLLPRQFQQVFGQPTSKFFGTHLLLLVQQNGLDYPRLGMVIGKKSVRYAVARNRLKRLTRASFCQHQAVLVGWDLVLVARKGVAELDNPAFFQQLDTFWRNLERFAARAAAELPRAVAKA